MMDARAGKGRSSTRKARLGDAERKGKAARPSGRGRVARVVKARGRVAAPANDTLPVDAELPAGALPEEATLEAGLVPTEDVAETELLEEAAGEESADITSSEDNALEARGEASDDD